MSIERAEQLKREWTDKFVVVQPDIPQLRRFRNLTGKVKTVNMNCRALVEFDGPEDIGWYDIDLDHLQIVDAPRKKAPAEAKHAPAEEKPRRQSPREARRQKPAANGPGASLRWWKTRRSQAPREKTFAPGTRPATGSHQSRRRTRSQSGRSPRQAQPAARQRRRQETLAARTRPHARRQQEEWLGIREREPRTQ